MPPTPAQRTICLAPRSTLVDRDLSVGRRSDAGKHQLHRADWRGHFIDLFNSASTLISGKHPFYESAE